MATFLASSLYVRGSESVRLVRSLIGKTTVRLVVRGPGQDEDATDFPDPLACARYQARLEQHLMAEGFRLERTHERRSGIDRRRARRAGVERRRATNGDLR